MIQPNFEILKFRKGNFVIDADICLGMTYRIPVTWVCCRSFWECCPWRRLRGSRDVRVPRPPGSSQFPFSPFACVALRSHREDNGYQNHPEKAKKSKIRCHKCQAHCYLSYNKISQQQNHLAQFLSNAPSDMFSILLTWLTPFGVGRSGEIFISQWGSLKKLVLKRQHYQGRALKAVL